MKNISIVNARTLAFVDTFALRPKGGIFYPDFVREFVQHCQFQKFPQTLAEFDMDKGVEFLIGKIDGKTIAKVTLFNTLVAVESRGGTEESKAIVDAILEWGKAKFGFNAPDVIKWGYVSDLFFQTDFPLLQAASHPLDKLAQKAGALVSNIWNEDLKYEANILTVGHDPQKRKYVIAPFTIQQRAEFHYSDNYYFSEAPLPTDTHIKLLEEFEADTLAMRK